MDFVETAFDDEKRRRPEVKGDYDERYEDERGETQITYKFEVLANGALRVWRTWEDGTDPVVDTVYGPTAWARVRGASMSV